MRFSNPTNASLTSNNKIDFILQMNAFGSNPNTYNLILE